MPFQESNNILSQGHYQSELDQLAALLNCESEAIKLKTVSKPPCNLHLNFQISKKLHTLEPRIRKWQKARLAAPSEQTHSSLYQCLQQKTQYISPRDSSVYQRCHNSDEALDLGSVGINVLVNKSPSWASSILQDLDLPYSQNKVTRCRLSRYRINATTENFSDFDHCQHGLRSTAIDPARENALIFRWLKASKAEFDSSPFATNSFRKSESSVTSALSAAPSYNEQTDASDLLKTPHPVRRDHGITFPTSRLSVPSSKNEFCRNENFARDIFVRHEVDMMEVGDSMNPTKTSLTPIIGKASFAQINCEPCLAKSSDFRMPCLVADTKGTWEERPLPGKTPAALLNGVDSVPLADVTGEDSFDQLEVNNFDFSESDLEFIASMESWLSEIGYPNIRSIPVELFDTDYLEAGDLEIDGEIFRKVFGEESVSTRSQTSLRPVDVLERKTSD